MMTTYFLFANYMRRPRRERREINGVRVMEGEDYLDENARLMLTPNEIRQKFGLPPLNGDEFIERNFEK